MCFQSFTEVNMIRIINAYDIGSDRKRDYRLFMLAFFLLMSYGIVLQIRYGWYKADSYVTTLLAFSYLKNGFIRRGLVGTLFDILCRSFPSIHSYRGATWFMWGMNVIYFFSLVIFIKWILGAIKERSVYKGAYIFSLICFTFMIPTACVQNGALGRADLLQIALCVVQIYLLIVMRHEWLTVLMTAVNVMFHEGYVLMTFCAVLIVIIYRALNTDGKKKRYWTLFALHIAVLLIMSVLSLVGSRRGGNPDGYAAALESAKALNLNGSVHWNLLYMMSGVTPENAEIINDAMFVAEGKRELPIFLICFIPAFIVFGKALVNLFRFSGREKIGTHITSVLLGPVLIGVEYLKFCDYGRYILWLVFYYFIVFVSFALMDDEGAKEALSRSYEYSNIKAILVLALMMMYQPLPTCSFTMISRKLKEWFLD